MYPVAALQFVASCTIDSSRMSVDSRLRHMLEIAINTPFFDRGDFPPVVQNGSSTIVLQNPWINGTKAAPFDQRKLPLISYSVHRGSNSISGFYLILNVAVGGTNGWFPDNNGHKPWLDGSQSECPTTSLALNDTIPCFFSSRYARVRSESEPVAAQLAHQRGGARLRYVSPPPLSILLFFSSSPSSVTP